MNTLTIQLCKKPGCSSWRLVLFLPVKLAPTTHGKSNSEHRHVVRKDDDHRLRKKNLKKIGLQRELNL